MIFDLPNGLTIKLDGFESSEYRDLQEATLLIVEALSRNADFPPLRSSAINLIRVKDQPPRYIANLPTEMILISSELNRPYQFIYQLSHELGHMMSQNWRRFGTGREYRWIEEAICGAYSIYCMTFVSDLQEHRFQVGATKYLQDYIDKAYSNVEAVGPDWYKANTLMLSTLDNLADLLKPLSRIIFVEMPDGSFVSDNVALINTDYDERLSKYLGNWVDNCRGPKSVPGILFDRLRPES